MGGLFQSARTAQTASGSEVTIGGNDSEVPVRTADAGESPAAVPPGPFDRAWAAYKAQGSSGENGQFPAGADNALPSSVQSDATAESLQVRRSGPDAAAMQRDLKIKKSYEERFKGTALANCHDVIVAASRKEGVPPTLAMSVIAQETRNGKAVPNNNIGGVMRGKNQTEIRPYKTLEEGIGAGVKVIANNYKAAGGDLEKMRDRYAPLGAANDKGNQNQHWLPNVRSIMRSLEIGRPPYKGEMSPVTPVPGIMIDENGSLRDRYTSPWQQSGDIDSWNRRYVFPKERR